jgi:RecA/RadA recombinase
MASALMKRMKKNSTVQGADTLSESKYFKREPISTSIPLLNVAFSGDFNGGLSAGITMLAGESRSFKTGFLIQLALAFQTKHKEGIVLFYDSEYSSLEYWISAGIDMERVLHIPVETVEELKIDITQMMRDISEDEDVMVVIDSIGGLASNKEVNDALDGKSTADMTRAKALNSLFRIITPMANKRNIPVVLINSFYETMELYAKRVYAGGKKVFLASDDVWFISRAQDKDGKELVGYNFNLNIDKSRTIREGSKFPINVTFADGIDKYSGIYELGKEFGAFQVAGAWVKIMDISTGELSGNVRANAIDDDYYESLIKHQPFIDFVKAKYVLN